MLKKIFAVCLWMSVVWVGRAAEISIPRLSPLPVGLAECKLLLNGEWLFSPAWNGGELPTDPVAAGWKPIQVPGEWVMQGFEVCPGEKAGYVRQFVVPAEWRGRRVKLRCNAVYSDCQVFLNGCEVGSHLGGFTPFEIDLTDRIEYGASNTIAFAVASESLADATSSASSYAVHPLGGITRDICLFALPEVNFGLFHVSTDLDSTCTDAVLRADVVVANESTAGAEGLNLHFVLTDAEGQEVSFAGGESVRALSAIERGEEEKLTVSLPVTAPRKWDPEHPYLYTLTCRLTGAAGETISTVSRRVGFRRIDVHGNQVFVNNRPIKLRGVCRHEVHPLRGRSLTGDLWRQDVELFRRGNVNYIRTSHYPPDEALLEACDELGMFVEVEAPFCWAHQTDVPNERHEAVLVNQHIEMVNRDRSHPSVLLWSIGNESLKFAEYFRRAAETVRAIDSTRPRNFSQWGPEADEGMLEVTNHHYPGPGGPDQYRNYVRPVVFDEYCHLNAYNRLELAADPGLRNMWGPLLDAMWNDMYHSQGVLGGAIWVGIDDTFFLPPDDRAVGYGTWGTIDGWRREKPEYWGMKKAYSPVKMRLLGNADAEGRIRLRVDNRHLFSDLSECRMEWSAGGAHGTVAVECPPRAEREIEIQLPDSVRNCSMLAVRVIGTRGFEIDRYAFRIRPETELQTRPKRSVSKVTCRERADRFEIGAGQCWFSVDKRTGLLSVEVSDRLVLTESPTLMLLPLNGEGEGTQMVGKDQSFEPYNPECGHWTASSMVCKPIEGGIAVEVRGSYDEATGGMTYVFRGDGSMEVAYDFTLLCDVSPRQTGLVFSLPERFSILNWKRRGYWSVYPEDHIGALEGKAVVFDPAIPVSGLAGPTRRPEVAWAFDQTVNGSNMFRSTKEHITEAALTDGEDGRVGVMSDGSQHFRAWKEGTTIRFLVADYNNAGSERFLVSHAQKGYKPLHRGDRVQGTVRVFF